MEKCEGNSYAGKVPPHRRSDAGPDVCFVADNPGDWMFHCHILDHQDGGMMAVIRVA
jgi:hypothetical protein